MGAVEQAPAVDLGRLVGDTVAAIRALVLQVVIIFLLDDSGSMFCWSTDMTNTRGAAALSLTNLLRSSGGGQIYVIRWGSHVGQVAGPLDVKRQRKQIKEVLRTQVNLGGNNLPAALHRAHGITKGLPEDKIVLNVVISDGIEAVTPATRSAISALPEDSVRLILVDKGNGCTPGMEADWRSSGMSSVNRLTRFDTTEMATHLGEILAQALGLELDTPDNAID
jgi:hypothetical protein